MLTQGHRVTRKLERVQSSCSKVALSNSNVRDDYVREMTVKKSCVSNVDHLSMNPSCFNFFSFAYSFYLFAMPVNIVDCCSYQCY